MTRRYTPVHASFNAGGQTARYEGVFKVANHALRVKIAVDSSYIFQSYASVSVLSANREWAELATVFPDEWHKELAFVERDGHRVRMGEVKDGMPVELTDLIVKLITAAVAILV